MTNKTRNKKQSQKNKKTPFADAGAIAGQALGQTFRMPYLKNIGKWLGSGIGQIFGSGDYQMVGTSPGYNVLTNDRQIPKFSAGDRTNIVCHREFLGDMTGTVAFTNRTFRLNPGDKETFPWLSTVAANYQQYRIHGMIFEFRPLITDFVTGGAPGVVVFATNYNAASTIYRSKVEMENSEYAVSVKPTQNLIHAIECASAETSITKLYVRDGPVPAGQDPRLYDMGITQLASQGNPVQLIGELWVSYCVEFFKPRLPEDIGLNAVTQNISRSFFTDLNPLGTIGLSSVGDLPGITIVSNSIYFSELVPDGVYMMQILWRADVAALVVVPTFTLTTGITQYGTLFNGTQWEWKSENGVGSRRPYYTAFFRLSGTDTAARNINVSAGTLPTTNTEVSIIITKVDDFYED